MDVECCGDNFISRNYRVSGLYIEQSPASFPYREEALHLLERANRRRGKAFRHPGQQHRGSSHSTIVTPSYADQVMEAM
jgi:hypothetical protein